MHVICTAGHVDHGKSSLVRALTGMEPDRFEEERRRGLTIDLGFAWTSLPGRVAQTVAFVDLPGHERFIANMLAGAGPVETALLVVAADEGWMPQSQEHLDILDLLQVRRGVVALSKADIADPQTVAATTADVRARLAGSPLAAAPIVACSAVTGAGLDELRAALAAVLDTAPAAADIGRPQLWVDRAFSVKGAGTVVTGTLAGGSLALGDAVTLQPGDRRGRVRGLQSLGETVQRATPGSRVAVNVSGIERAAARRGDRLGLPGQWLATTALEGWVRVLPGAELGRRGAWHLHAGSSRRSATVIPVDGRPLRGESAGAQGAVRVELDEPLALAAGDRFVLREAGRWTTVAGGVVVDPDPPAAARGGRRADRVAALDAGRAALDAGDLAALLDDHLRRRGAARMQRAAAALGMTGEQAAQAARQHRLLSLGDTLVHPAAASLWSTAVLDALRAHHAAHPVERAAPKDLATRAAVAAGCPQTLAPAFLDTLVALGRVAAEARGLRDPAHRVRLDPAHERARTALLAALDAEPFAPPSLEEAARRAGAPAVLLKELEAAGELVRLAPDIAVTAATLTAAVERLRAAFTAEGPLTAARAKAVLGTSRKYALPLLEELDRRGLTRRTGDVRELR